MFVKIQVKNILSSTRRMDDVESCLTGFIYLKSFDPVLHKHYTTQHNTISSRIEGDFQDVRNRGIFWLFDILRQQ